MQVYKGKSYDKQYQELCSRIYEEGELDTNPRPRYEDGEPAHVRSVFHHTFKFTPQDVPLLFSKKVFTRQAIEEMLWIWRDRSNVVKDLQDKNVQIWNSWDKPPKYYMDGRELVYVKVRENTVGVVDYETQKINGVLIEETEENIKLRKHWRTMLHRVYKKKYNGNWYDDVTVCKEWFDVNVFIQDVKKLPNYRFKLDDWKSFHLDKDYYGSKVYSPHTCIWLPENENVLYAKNSCKVIRVIDSEGTVKDFLGSGAIMKKYGIAHTTIWNFIQKEGKLKNLRKNNTKFNGWEFKYLDVKDGYVPRLKLIDGTIGKAYGYQLAQEVGHTGRNQVDNLIHNLKTNPESRRHIVHLWNVEDIDDMALTPCVFLTQWCVIGNELHLEVIVRSNDIALGNPFNCIQYWVLHKLIAQEVGIKAGDVMFTMVMPHIYDRHFDTINEQMSRLSDLNSIDPVDDKEITVEIDDVGLYDFTMDNIRIKGYDNFGGEPLKKYSFEVGI